MPKKTAEPSFEQIYSELETTIEQLEAGNLSLDEALVLYERGMELAKQCGVMLDRAELKIQELGPSVTALDEDELDEELLDGDDDE
jgi:exodeoxyribonuclease VII small subunit